MGRRCVGVLVIALAIASGCGRVGFDAIGGSTDGHADTESLASCLARFDFCDGFEAPTIGGVWNESTIVGRSTSVVHRGAGAIHARTSALGAGQSGRSLLGQLQAFAGQPATTWIRAWFRLSALPQPGNHVEIIQADQTSGPDEGNYVFVHSNDLDVYSQFENQTVRVGQAPPTNTWFCLIWKIDRAVGPTGSLELRSDLFAPITLPNARTDGSPPFDQLAFGLSWASSNVNAPQPAFEIYVDDVIVDTDGPITCDD